MEQMWFYSGKVVVFGQSGFVRVKVVVIGQKLLYSGKKLFYSRKVVVVGQK